MNNRRKGIVKGKGKGTVKVEVKGKGNSKNFSIETGALGGRNLQYCHPLYTSATLFGRIQKQYWRGPVNLPIVTPFINARLTLPGIQAAWTRVELPWALIDFELTELEPGGGVTSVVEPVGFVEDSLRYSYIIQYCTDLYFHIYTYTSYLYITWGWYTHWCFKMCSKITSGTLKREVRFVSGGVHVNFR